MEEDRLAHFVTRGLETHGAVVYGIDKDLIETLMPQELAQRMGLKEEQRFGFGPSYQNNPEVEYISYNSEALERFSLLVDSGGFFSILLCRDVYLKQKGLEKLVSGAISFLNTTYRFLERKEASCPYLLLNCKYTAISEEKQEGIIPILINEHTLASPPRLDGFEAYLEEHARPLASPEELPGNLLEPRTLNDVMERACGVAKVQIHKGLADFEKSLSRRMQRDIERINEYYGTIIKEIEKRIKKRRLTGEEKEKEESRITATETELKKKVLDQHKRYSLKVRVELVNALRIIIPVICLAYEVHRKKARKGLTLIWNPLTKDLELPLCENCFAGAGSFFLCNEHLHHLCPKCYEACPGCGKQYCRRCHPWKCPYCSAPGS